MDKNHSLKKSIGNRKFTFILEQKLVHLWVIMLDLQRGVHARNVTNIDEVKQSGRVLCLFTLTRLNCECFNSQFNKDVKSAIICVSSYLTSYAECLFSFIMTYGMIWVIPKSSLTLSCLCTVHRLHLSKSCSINAGSQGKRMLTKVLCESTL